MYNTIMPTSKLAEYMTFFENEVELKLVYLVFARGTCPSKLKLLFLYS